MPIKNVINNVRTLFLYANFLSNFSECSSYVRMSMLLLYLGLYLKYLYFDLCMYVDLHDIAHSQASG